MSAEMPVLDGRLSAVVKLPSKRAIPALTGIRGLAALWVMIFHIVQGGYQVSLLPGLAGVGLLANGYRGVDLFFILSGYIMMHVHAGDFVTIRPAAIRRFALMRIIRIYPASLAALLAVLAAVLCLPGMVAWVHTWQVPGASHYFSPIGFLQTLTLTNRWLVPDYGLWNGPTWSLSAELLAYTTLPVVAWALNRVTSKWACAALAVGALAGVLLLLLAIGDTTAGNSNRPGVARAFGGFIAGAAVCRLTSLAPQARRAGAAAAAFGCAMVIVLSFCGQAAVLMPFCFALVIGGVSYGAGPVNGLCANGVAMFLGKISFSVYLVHLPMLMVLEYLTLHAGLTAAQMAVVAALYLAVVLVVAPGLHYAVERPSQKAGHRLIRMRAGYRGRVAALNGVL